MDSFMVSRQSCVIMDFQKDFNVVKTHVFVAWKREKEIDSIKRWVKG